IDDFARRLSEFVTSAGNTLYRGIGEILDRTLRERRERSTEVSALRSSTTAQIQQVVAARAALAALREGVWTVEPAAVEPAPEPVALPEMPVTAGAGSDDDAIN